MSLYQKFPTKSYDKVREILINTGHKSILDNISKHDGFFSLRKSINDISPLPTYQFAIACTLASLGNPDLDERTYPSGAKITEAEWGDNISRDLVKALMDQ